MRKKRLIICTLAFVVVTISLVILMLYITRSDILYIASYKQNYSLVSNGDEEKEFTVPIYVSDKKSFIVNMEKLSNSYVSSFDDSEKIEVKVNKIIDMKNNKEINNEKYFLYHFIIKINLDIDDEFKIMLSEAYLNIEYPSYEASIVRINIGSFSYIKVPYYGALNNEISLTKIKPIVNYVGNKKTLVGLNIDFKNNGNQNIVLKQINIYDSNIYVSTDNIISKKEEFLSGDNLSKILGYTYLYVDGNYNNSDINILISGNEEVSYIIPFKYLKECIINKVGFEIVYEINNEVYKLYYTDFKYFDDNTKTINDSEFIISSYEQN